jgi:hypothetical protein
MYAPTLGRFLSRDPLRDNDPVLLFPVPDMRSQVVAQQEVASEPPYVYALNKVHPTKAYLVSCSA